MRGDADDELYRLIGRQISVKRRTPPNDLSQFDLAEKLGMSRASIVNIECGRHRIQIHVLFQIARILGIEVQDLMPRFADSGPTPALPKKFANMFAPEERDGVERLVQHIPGGAKKDG